LGGAELDDVPEARDPPSTLSTADDKFTPERHPPAPGQRGRGPQRHTAAGAAAPLTTDTGEPAPQRANPTQTRARGGGARRRVHWPAAGLPFQSMGALLHRVGDAQGAREAYRRAVELGCGASAYVGWALLEEESGDADAVPPCL